MDKKNEQVFRVVPYWRVLLWLSVYLWIGAGILTIYMTALDLRETKTVDSRALFLLPGFLLACVGFSTARFLLKNEPPLIISEQGISETKAGFGLIPWQEIMAAEVRVETVRLVPCTTLYLKVENPKTYLRRVSLLTRLSVPFRFWREKLIPLDFSRLDGGVEEAVEWIRLYRPGISVDYSSKDY